MMCSKSCECRTSVIPGRYPLCRDGISRYHRGLSDREGLFGMSIKPFSANELMSVANRFIQKEVNGKGNVDLIPLYEFGEKQRTLWLFEEETEENIHRIDKAWEKGDRHELKEILHSIKRYLGTDRMW